MQLQGQLLRRLLAALRPQPFPGDGTAPRATHASGQPAKFPRKAAKAQDLRVYLFLVTILISQNAAAVSSVTRISKFVEDELLGRRLLKCDAPLCENRNRQLSHGCVLVP